jgi:hypothetical protein
VPNPPHVPDRILSGRRGLRGIALTSAIIAAAATIVLDQHRATRNRQADPGSVTDIAATFDPTIDHSLLPAPLVPGDLAPNSNLVDVRSGGRANLSDYRGRPVVLVFGSHRCEVLRAQLDGLNELRAAYANRVGFLFIVIRGAGRPETDAPAPEAIAPDASHAADLQSVRDELDRFHLTTLVDEHDMTARTYNAFPRRLLIVDAAGRIAFDGARGAIGASNDWDLQAVRAHLDSLLGYTR